WGGYPETHAPRVGDDVRKCQGCGHIIVSNRSWRRQQKGIEVCRKVLRTQDAECTVGRRESRDDLLSVSLVKCVTEARMVVSGQQSDRQNNRRSDRDQRPQLFPPGTVGAQDFSNAPKHSKSGGNAGSQDQREQDSQQPRAALSDRFRDRRKHQQARDDLGEIPTPWPNANTKKGCRKREAEREVC